MSQMIEHHNKLYILDGHTLQVRETMGNELQQIGSLQLPTGHTHPSEMRVVGHALIVLLGDRLFKVDIWNPAQLTLIAVVPL